MAPAAAVRCSPRTHDRFRFSYGGILTVEVTTSTEDFGAARQLLHASTVADWGQ